MSFWNSVSRGLSDLTEVTKEFVKEIAENSGSEDQPIEHNEDDFHLLLEENRLLKIQLTHIREAGDHAIKVKMCTLQEQLVKAEAEITNYKSTLKDLRLKRQARGIPSETSTSDRKKAKLAGLRIKANAAKLQALEKEKNTLIEELNESKRESCKIIILEKEKKTLTKELNKSKNKAAKLEKQFRVFEKKLSSEAVVENNERVALESLRKSKFLVDSNDRTESETQISEEKLIEQKTLIENYIQNQEQLDGNIGRWMESQAGKHEQVCSELEFVTEEFEKVKVELSQAKAELEKRSDYEMVKLEVVEAKSQGKKWKTKNEKLVAHISSINSQPVSELGKQKSQKMIMQELGKVKSQKDENQSVFISSAREYNKIVERLKSGITLETEYQGDTMKTIIDRLDRFNASYHALSKNIHNLLHSQPGKIKKFESEKDGQWSENAKVSNEAYQRLKARCKNLEQLKKERETLEHELEDHKNQLRTTCRDLGAPFPERGVSSDLAIHIRDAFFTMRENHERDLNGQEEEMVTLRDQYSQLQAVQRDMLLEKDDLEHSLHEREMEAVELSRRVSQLEAALEHSRISTQDILEEERQVSDELRAQCEKLKDENHGLNWQTLELKKTVDQSFKESYISDHNAAQKHTGVTRKLESVILENQSLKESLRMKYEEINEQTSRKDKEIARLSNEVTHLKHEYVALESFSKDHSTLKTELADKTDRLEKVQNALQNLEMLMFDYQTEKAALQEHVEDESRKKLELSLKLDKALEAANRSEKLRKEVQDLRSRQAQSSDYILKLSKDNDALKNIVLDYSEKKLSPKPNEFNVDRRIVNKLLVTFVERYKENKNTEQVLTVMSRFLQFTKEENEKIGFIKAASTPASLVWGLTSAFMPSSPASGDKLLSEASEKNISDLWVSFLLTEANPNQPLILNPSDDKIISPAEQESPAEQKTTQSF